MPNKLIKKGVKKLFSLTRTKIRLAEEAKTKETKPKPLPLVKFFSGKEIKTVTGAKRYRSELLKKINFEDNGKIAETVLQLLDIIEGVKYKFEAKDCCFLLDEEELEEIEKQKVNILLMTQKPYPGTGLFIGENEPKSSILASRVPSSIATFLAFAFKSKYFFKDGKLKHITSVLGHKTLLTNVIHFSLGELGASLKEEK